MARPVLEEPQLSVRSILAAVEAGDITPRDVVAEARQRIAGGDGTVKAFVRLSAEDGALEGPLAGVPIGVKDVFDTADMPTEMGSPIYAGFQPRADAAVVAMARNAGATVIGKTATTEFASIDPTVTENPIAPGHTPGGSSSGSAAGIAAGFIAAAVGTQTGGSVIRPASFCGITGYKPSFRLLPTVGMKTFSWSLDTTGLFAKSVADVALFADRLTGRALDVALDADATGLRVGYYRSAIDDRLEPDMAAAVERGARLLERAGAIIVEIDEPASLTAARDAHGALQGYEAIRALAHEYSRHRSELGPLLAALLDEAATIGPETYDEARRAARIARKAATALFGSVDVLLAPSALGAPPRSLASTGDALMNKLWTLTGNPVVGVPGMVSSAGLPLGLSVIARFGQDAQALQAAHRLDMEIQAENRTTV